jgi:hypothetical protein
MLFRRPPGVAFSRVYGQTNHITFVKSYQDSHLQLQTPHYRRTPICLLLPHQSFRYNAFGVRLDLVPTTGCALVSSNAICFDKHGKRICNHLTDQGWPVVTLRETDSILPGHVIITGRNIWEHRLTINDVCRRLATVVANILVVSENQLNDSVGALVECSCKLDACASSFRSRLFPL